MKFSITIPQLFYDLIARIMPGFLFLVLLRIDLDLLGQDFGVLSDESSGNFVTSFLNGIGVAMLCYFLGWIFSSFSFASSSTSIKNEEIKKNEIALLDMYHFIRFMNPNEGFRIVKLRAEARMLESSRIGMFALIIILIAIFILYQFSLIDLRSVALINWIIVFFIPGVFMLGFWLSESPAWKRYYGNIPITFSLIKKYEKHMDSDSLQEATKNKVD
jgi:hypothetical protein